LCDGNERIIDIGHLSNTLIELSCNGDERDYWHCGVRQDSIDQLKILEKLCCDHNKDIKDVNNLANTLVELNCGWDSGMDQNGISKLKKIKSLKFSNNNNIDNVSHLAGTIEKLDCSHNNKINNIDKLTRLKELHCCGDNTIGQSEIRNLKNSIYWTEQKTYLYMTHHTWISKQKISSKYFFYQTFKLYFLRRYDALNFFNWNKSSGVSVRDRQRITSSI